MGWRFRHTGRHLTGRIRTASLQGGGNDPNALACSRLSCFSSPRSPRIQRRPVTETPQFFDQTPTNIDSPAHLFPTSEEPRHVPVGTDESTRYSRKAVQTSWVALPHDAKAPLRRLQRG
eukprot:Phypoly_transcript_01422.p2 GENE.Phypoly_transcript_01422~~Phypoly_transcript_01422.p2  ORF type:complete len:119 (+),score=1.91 Phypoly_transcript_01422:2789-3145(+)